MVLKIIKNFSGELYNNPKEGWELIKMLGGALILLFFGAIGFACAECYEKVLDKCKRKG